MRDFLHTTLDKNEIFEMSSLALAHIGDAAFELMVRSNLCKGGMRKAKELHKNTVLSVSASAQEAASKKILPHLTEEEHDVYLRGRNAKVNSLPKHATPETYHAATAFEALWGWLYLSGRYERLNELFEVIVSE
ncbi:MAG: ribonuclease III [Oscillospiraceae bacterium]|nr:ribonuclease III [Oscillospiraceae bacterium]